MRNATIKVDGDKMVITINLAENLGLSKSGKSTLIATTEGNAKVQTNKGEVAVGLNVYQSAK
jgi:Fe-S cluster assembly ATPase SufC